MSRKYVELNEAADPGAKVNVFESLETIDGDEILVVSQGVVVVDEDGDPVGPASESTLQDVLAAVATLDGGVFAAPFSGTNGDVVTLAAAMPVAQPTTTLKRAVNSSASLAAVAGVVVVGAAITLPVRALAQGTLTLPASTWDAVTGASGGLVPGAKYYLDGTPGKLTTTPPSTPGLFVTLVGMAVSEVTLLVDPQLPILL